MYLLYLHIHLTFVQESMQTYYLWDGDKRWFWGVVHLCCQWGAWHRHIFVLHVVYSIPKGLNGISCRDRDIKSLAFHCHPSKKPASRQIVLSQLLGPLPNLWQLIEHWRWSGIEEVKKISAETQSFGFERVRKLRNLPLEKPFRRLQNNITDLCLVF